MSKVFHPPILIRLALLLVLFPLLGISPRPHGLGASLEKANRALRSGMYLAAAEHLAAAAAFLPYDPALLQSAGRHALEGGEPQQAVVYLARIPEDRRSSEIHLLLGEAYLEIGDLGQAIAWWEKVLAAEGPSPGVCQRLWQAHLARGEYPAALAYLSQQAALQPGDARLQYQHALLTVTQQPERAVDLLAKTAAMDPSLAPVAGEIRRAILGAEREEEPAYTFLAAGRALAAQGEWNLAAEAFRQAVSARPDYAEAWAYLGEARQHTASHVLPLPALPAPPHDGLSDLHKALDLAPDSLAAQVFLAFYWERQGQYDQALAVIGAGLARRPEDPWLYLELGNAYHRSGDLPAALEAYQAAAALAPDEAGYQKVLAEFSLQNEYDIPQIALPAARRALLIAPEDPAMLDLMGQVLLALGDYSSAERFLMRALAAGPDYAPAHLHLGLLYHARGERDLANQEFRLAGSLAPGSPAAEQAAQVLQAYYP